MSNIHMAIIRITIFISEVCFYVLLIICKMLWFTTSTTQMAFTTVTIINTSILFVNHMSNCSKLINNMSNYIKLMDDH